MDEGRTTAMTAGFNMTERGDYPMPTDERHFEFKMDLLHETEKAFLVQKLDSEKEIWIPKSQVEMHDEDGVLTFVIPEWLCKEKGLR